MRKWSVIGLGIVGTLAPSALIVGCSGGPDESALSNSGAGAAAGASAAGSTAAAGTTSTGSGGSASPASGGNVGTGGSPGSGGSGTSNAGSGGLVIGGDGAVSLAAAGDWDDGWDGDVTEVDIQHAAQHDLIAMVGDLSYGDTGVGVANAEAWSLLANSAAGDTPIIFVPGDHDSIAQDGDITTYANTLQEPSGGVISAPTTGDYGQYPYLYYVDMVRDGVGVRVVGTSIAYEEPESEPADTQKYLSGYGEGSMNYNWLNDVYADAKGKGYWLVHINHLPCIDMGKNKTFDDCEAIVNLDAQAGVNVLIDGSSHNVWRSKQLQQSADCPTITLTGSSGGANPACAKDSPDSVYQAAGGLINAHAGTAGKDSASDGPNCDAAIDSEVLHYAKDGACYIDGVTGIFSANFTATTLTGEFLLVSGETLPDYKFTIVR